MTAKATSHCNKSTVREDVFCAVRPKVIFGEPMGDPSRVVSGLQSEKGGAGPWLGGHWQVSSLESVVRKYSPGDVSGNCPE